VPKKKTFPLHGSVSCLTIHDTWVPSPDSCRLPATEQGGAAPYKKSAPRIAARPDSGLLFDQPIGTGT
jgi:hypothetical protein